MLEQLTLRDFQAHEKLRIDLDPNVTTIVGSSDQGKSAVLRALRWLATNRPGGDAFVRTSAELTKVTLKVDGREIRRTRGKGKNTYHLDSQPLKAFGAEVPIEVASLLNTNDTNFQGQHDAPFWFSETAGSVSRSLNQIINLGIIDDVLGFLATQQRDATTRTSSVTSRVATTEAAWQELKPIKTMDRELKEVEALETVASANRLAASLVSDLALEASKQGERASNAQAELASGLAVVAAGEGWRRLCEKQDKLGLLVLEAGKLLARASKPVPDLTGLEAAELAFRAATFARDGLAKLLHEAATLSARETQAKGASMAAKVLFETQLGKKCPLCEQPIKTP